MYELNLRGKRESNVRRSGYGWWPPSSLEGDALPAFDGGRAWFHGPVLRTQTRAVLRSPAVTAHKELGQSAMCHSMMGGCLHMILEPPRRPGRMQSACRFRLPCEPGREPAGDEEPRTTTKRDETKSE